MPYKIEEHDGKWCVMNSDTGENKGCSPTQAEAEDHMEAMYAAENKAKGNPMTKPTPEQRKAMAEKMAWLFDQQTVNYVMLSATDGQACANCIFYRASGFDSIEWPHCHIVSDYPDPIEPTGWCERWEAKPEPPPPEPTVAEAVGELADAIGEMVGMDMEMAADGQREMYISPADGAIAALRKSLTAKLTPGLSVMKDTAGRRHMFMITSNGYKDRDEEYVATKALKAYVDACWTGDDTAFLGQNDHYPWHIKTFGSMSDLMFADIWSGFLVEIWREQADDPIAKSFYNFVERHTEIEWGASHGFKGLLERDTFTHIKKFESSTLPLEAAANLLTLSEVLPMTAKNKRDQFLDQWMKEEFGIEGAAAMLHEGPDKLRAALLASGVQAKALGEGSDALKAAREEAIANTAETIISIVEVQDEQDREIVVGKAKQVDYEKQMKTLSDEVKRLTGIVNAGPRRAATAPETVVTDEAARKAAEEQTVEYDPAFPGMKVPLEKKP